MNNAVYPRLMELKIEVRDNTDCEYILLADVARRLSRKDRLAFEELIAEGTRPFVAGGPAVYAEDAESVLQRLVEGERTGAAAFWD